LLLCLGGLLLDKQPECLDLMLELLVLLPAVLDLQLVVLHLFVVDVPIRFDELLLVDEDLLVLVHAFRDLDIDRGWHSSLGFGAPSG
jgi:hypothetical protein